MSIQLPRNTAWVFSYSGAQHERLRGIGWVTNIPTSKSVDFEIEEPTTLTATIDISWPFANLNIDGGTTPYQYSLDGVNFQDENTFGPLISGDYTVEVIDSNGCILTENFVITYETMTF